MAHATDLPGTINAVAVATCHPASCPRPFDTGRDTPNLWCAGLGGLTFCGVFMPLGAATVTYWKTLIEQGRRKGLDLIIGDFIRA